MGEDIRAREESSSAQGESVADNSNIKPRRNKWSIDRHRTRSKQREVESSAYWDNLPENEEGEKVEPIEANPDVIMDDSEDYRSERDEYGDQLKRVKIAMKKLLSPREFQAMQLLQQGFNYDKIASNMGIKKGSVQIMIERARQKLVTILSQE